MKNKTIITAYLNNERIPFSSIDKTKARLLGTNEYYPYGIRDKVSKLRVKEFYYATKK